MNGMTIQSSAAFAAIQLIPVFRTLIVSKSKSKQETSFTKSLLEIFRQKREKKMAQTFKGKSTDSNGLIVNSNFWTKGKKIEAIVQRKFTTTNGVCYALLLKSPIKVGKDEASGATGKLENQIAIGESAGLTMALQACGAEELLRGDVIKLECIGQTPTTKGNPRTDFDIVVVRD